MPARQYIGARYVTKVYENSQDPGSAEWEAGINYEPLTMVTYNMGSYLSKKEVPASVGDPASNPQYWVQTGFYNGQIAYLDSIKQNKELDTPVTVDGTLETTVEGAVGAMNTFLASVDSDKLDRKVATTQAIETLGAASINAHDYGQCFIADDGFLYAAISNIVAGETLTVNTNCKKTSLVDQIFGIRGVKLPVVSGNSTKTYDLSSGGVPFSGIILTNHNSNTGLGYVASVRGAGFLKEIVGSTYISASVSNSVLTMTNTSTATANVFAIILEGDISAI